MRLSAYWMITWIAATTAPLAAGEVVPPDPGGSVDVRSCGAVGDGRQLDTAAIQGAIDAAAARGGGTVHVPAGRFLTGALALRSNVTLHLHGGATLLASTNVEHYGARAGLIHAEGGENVAVTGRGTIDGRGGDPGPSSRPGESEKELLAHARKRGRVLYFARCRNVRVEGITLINSPSWMQHYFECEDVVVDGIRVRNHCNHYNDGLDIDGCRDVRISNCRISSGDDAIVLKSRSRRPCENVTITNCIVSSHSNGLKLGTESHGGFRNVAISNVVVLPVDTSEPRRNGAPEGLAGVAVETVDGGLLEHVVASNLTIRGTIAPLFVRLGDRGRRLGEEMERPPVATLRHVSISHVVATGASSVGCAIAGLPGHPIEDLALSDISITFSGDSARARDPGFAAGGTLADMQREIPEEAGAYPECTMFGKLPAYGLYVRHAQGVTLRNVRLRWTAADQRPALYCHDVHRLDIGGLHARSGADAGPVVFLRDVADAFIHDCTAAAETNTFLGLAGTTRSVSLIGNKLGAAFRVLERQTDVPADALFEAANERAERE